MNKELYIRGRSMDEFVKLLNHSLDYVEHRIENNHCIITVKSNRLEAKCPYCGHTSAKVHSVYQKKFQDLPIQDKQVTIILNNRKMFCLNPECTHKTFAERFDFISYKSRKTKRLVNRILNLSANVSSLTASKILKADKVLVGKSTICNMLKKNSSNCG